jgi:hypothetical protein
MLKREKEIMWCWIIMIAFCIVLWTTIIWGGLVLWKNGKQGLNLWINQNIEERLTGQEHTNSKAATLVINFANGQKEKMLCISISEE